MKKHFKYLTLAFFSVIFFSCDKKESKIYYEGGTPPVLTVSTTAPMVLDISKKDQTAIKLSWTNPNYIFTTGLSSQNVTYTLQIDTTGSNFTNPKMQQVVIANDLSATLTVGTLNSYLLTMGLLENMPHNIEIRIKSTLANNAAPLFSNVVKLTITPYLDVKYPVPAKLYITGSATPGNWMGGGDPELVSQRFTKVSSSQFKITIALSANNSFLLVPVYGDWSNKYGGLGGNNTNNVYGDDFRPGGSDLKAPPVSGTYTITVDFKTGKYTVQ